VTRHYTTWTGEEKDFLRANYTGNLASVHYMSQRTGHPVPSVKGQLHKLGLGRQIDRRTWTVEEEDSLTELITQCHITKVAELLNRSVNSVAVKAQRMKLSRRIRDGYFTQKEVAELLGVDSHWVKARISRGELKAEPINGHIPDNGGSRWCIKEKDIRRFVIGHAMSLTGRNVDLSLLVYILTGE